MLEVDRWTLGYAVVAAAVVAVRGREAPVPGFLLMCAGVAGLVLLMPVARRAGVAGRWLGDWYPLVLVVALYSAVGSINEARGQAYDAIVQSWEQALFASQPSREWIRRAGAPWLAWPLHLGYLAYYPIVVLAPGVLWLTGRRDAMQRVLARIMAAFYVCYVAFLVFPVAGPRYAFPPADNTATATAVARVAAGLLETFAAWGTAFPSSHVAASVTAVAAAFRESRALGWTLLPPALLLVAGAVYGQFHYAVDVLAGVAVAGAVVAVDAIRNAAGRAR